jgi:hypothetical protein
MARDCRRVARCYAYRGRDASRRSGTLSPRLLLGRLGAAEREGGGQDSGGGYLEHIPRIAWKRAMSECALTRSACLQVNRIVETGSQTIHNSAQVCRRCSMPCALRFCGRKVSLKSNASAHGISTAATLLY